MRTFLAHGWRIGVGLVGFSIGLNVLIILYRHITSPLNPHYMKPTTFFTTTALLFIGMVGFIACATMDNRKMTEYSVIRDLTDSVKVMPDEQALVADLGLDTNIWNGVNFNFFNVSDVSYTPHWRVSLAKGGQRIASSEFTRKREVTAFKAKLSAILDSARNDTVGRDHSSIYLPIVEELTRFSNSSATRKVLVVYSDLMENTPDISFYKAKTFALLTSKPDEIKAMLFNKAKLPDLTGVEIHLIYEPRNAKDDARYRVVSGFFKQTFQTQGAKVFISANLTE